MLCTAWHRSRCGCRRSTAPRQAPRPTQEPDERPDRTFRRASVSATKEAYGSTALVRYNAHVVVPRVIEVEIAVLKGIMGQAIVTIEARKGVYKEQRRVLKRLADALWSTDALWSAGSDVLEPAFAADFVAAQNGRPSAPGSWWIRSRASPTRARSIGTTGSSARSIRPRLGSGLRVTPVRARRRTPSGCPWSKGALMPRILQADVGRGEGRGRTSPTSSVSVWLSDRPGSDPSRDCVPSSTTRRARASMCASRWGTTTASAAGNPATSTRSCGRWTTSASPRPWSVSPGASDTRCITKTGERLPRPAVAAVCTLPTPRRRSSSVRNCSPPDAEAGRRFLGERGFDAGACRAFRSRFRPRAGGTGCSRPSPRRDSRARNSATPGLVSTGQRGVYDRFRGRLVWPIRDVSGQTIGFGARKLFDDDQGPKYLKHPRGRRSTRRRRCSTGSTSPSATSLAEILAVSSWSRDTPM